MCGEGQYATTIINYIIECIDALKQLFLFVKKNRELQQLKIKSIEIFFATGIKFSCGGHPDRF